MIGRIELAAYSDAEAQAQGYSLLTTFLELELKDGRCFQARAYVSKGSHALPMSEDEVACKFRECAEFSGWPSAHTAKTIEMIAGLDELENVRTLTALLGKATG